MAGRTERWIASLFGRIPKIFLYGPVPLLIAALIKIEQLRARRVGLLLLGVWLIVDLWAWIFGKHSDSSFRFVGGCLGSAVILMCITQIMAWWLADSMRHQQEEVFQKLQIDAFLPPGLASPLGSFFTVINNGATNIQSGYTIVCELNYLLVDHVVIRAHPPHDPTFSNIGKGSTAPMNAGGGSDSAACLSNYIVGQNFKCADVTIKFMYYLEIDDHLQQTKYRRFATGRNGISFQWYPRIQKVQKHTAWRWSHHPARDRIHHAPDNWTLWCVKIPCSSI
jgi:hypothetical protein